MMFSCVSEKLVDFLAVFCYFVVECLFLVGVIDTNIATIKYAAPGVEGEVLSAAVLEHVCEVYCPERGALRGDAQPQAADHHGHAGYAAVLCVALSYVRDHQKHCFFFLSLW